MTTPAKINRWQYTSTKGGIEKNLRLVEVKTAPKPNPTQHLVRVLAASLNPVDYKPAEAPVVGRFLVPNPASPGTDFAGVLITPAQNSDLKPGQLVFGCSGTSPFAGASLADVALVETDYLAPIPDGLTLLHAASIPVTGQTALQSIAPYVKSGGHIFLNGGSGGTGVFGIQIAKALGCHVTTTCSTANVELCKSLGADEVIDYRKQDVAAALRKQQHKFDHIVDNVGSDLSLYFKCHEFTTPKAAYLLVAGSPSLGFIVDNIRSKLPGYLGGANRKLITIFSKCSRRELEQLANWMVEGKVRAVIDSEFDFANVPKAYEKIKTGRSKGKIVIKVADEA